MSGARVVLRGAAFAPVVGASPVLAGVDATATAGRITVVVGANAAGKTTMLRTVSGLVPPAAGHLAIERSGKELQPWRLSPRRRASLIASMAQRVRLAAGFGVEESVAMGRYALARNPGRVAQAMAAFALEDLRDRAVETLSIGQQQRVGLARTLAQHEPSGILVLDEPFAPLDLRETARAAGVLRSAADAGAVVLASVHDLGLASRFGDDVWVLENERLVAAGPAAEILDPRRLASMFGAEAIALAGLDRISDRPRG